MFQQREHLFDEADDVSFGNEFAIDLNAFAKGDEVRGGEEADAESRCAIDAFEHGTGGTFAIGAGDVYEAKLVMRIAGEFGQLERVCKAKFGSKPAEAIKELDGL